MPVHEAPNVMRARLDLRRLTTELAWVAGAVVVLALLSPLGILRDQGLGARLFYWARTIGVGYVLHRPLLWLGGMLALKAGVREWTGWIGGLIVGCAPMALWLWYFGPRINPARPFPSDALWAETAGQVLLISGLMALCLWFIDELRRPPHEAVTVETPAASHSRPALLDRLPVGLSGPLIALRAEDHYVRVYTERGSHLLLIRMNDAVAETAPEDGYWVHRSWWVAKAAVKEMEAAGRRIELRLSNGLLVPVARTRGPQVRQWLAKKNSPATMAAGL